MARRFWLLKSDPETYGLEHLKRERDGTTSWDGVRNFQARNLLRDEIRKGDGVLFYHSRSKPPAVVAIARVVRAAYPDPTQFDRRSRYFDARSTREEPRWYAVDVKLDRELRRPVALPEMRDTPDLRHMALLRKGNRLSVQPVTPEEWKTILAMGRR